MILSGRIDGSIRSVILSRRVSSAAVLTAASAACDLGHAKGRPLVGPARSTRSPPLPGPVHSVYKSDHANFSSATTTIASGSPSRHVRPDHFTQVYPGEQPRDSPDYVATQPFQLKALPPPARSKDELLALVDQHDDLSVEEQLEFVQDPYMRRYAPAARQELTVSDRAHDNAFPLSHEAEKGNEDEQLIVTKLRAAVFLRLMRPHSVTIESIYELYCSLPGQRITYLNGRLRHALLATLGQVERKSSTAMLRYFAVVADAKNSGYALRRVDWNTAMSFASRYVSTSTEVEAESALHLWREMEQDAGIRGNEVTFNILFDVASKAGKFALAEMIYQEMRDRKMSFNRYHHVSLIHYFGLRMDSSGVRAAYRDMVEAGEIVDTVTLNCVISSLIKCGEEDAAERVYEKMKLSDKRSKLMPARNYRSQKKVTMVFDMFARFGRRHPELQTSLQGAASLSPDLATYKLLVFQAGVRMGDLAKVAKYLDEMKWFRVPLHGAIFIMLFKAFARHGLTSGSDWSHQRLEGVWKAFLEAFDANADGLYISTWMAGWILQAFAKCTQDRERLLAAYEELSDRWDLDADNAEYMLDFLHKTLKRLG